MKRYAVFYFNLYYPKGGMDDLIGNFDSIKEATDSLFEHHKVENPFDEHWNDLVGYVYDIEKMEYVFNV